LPPPATCSARFTTSPSTGTARWPSALRAYAGRSAPGTTLSDSAPGTSDRSLSPGSSIRPCSPRDRRREDNAAALSAPGPGRLVHGDFHPRHVFADGHRITGIIDWGDAASGDPLYDFGRILHSAILASDLNFGIEAVSLVRRTYGNAPWFQDDPIRQLLAYGVIFTLSAMRSELAGGAPWPPWWPAQEAALATMLDAL
jgi:hypothetical protein